jgi:hypothetical protein
MTSSLPGSSSGSNLGENLSQTDDGPVTATKTASLTSSSNGLHSTPAGGQASTMLDPVSEGGPRGDGLVRKKLSKLLKGKEEEWTAVAQKKGPLQLLDLPVDVLKEIIKEVWQSVRTTYNTQADYYISQVTHTNDLTSLALTHSALHNLAIPHIYSRFDIVWPDATSTSDTRTGVDALTYGLATLVMGHDVFGQTPESEMRFSGSQNGQRRRGNNYPQFTRKFSLGNGPAEWVQEYMITKESGKMLGTLVALAVARMVNLETFIWDMPTGVLRDVWLALSSLQDKCPPGECRLERLLVRWHDNSLDSSHSSPNANANTNPATHNPVGSTLTPIGIMIPSGAAVSPQQATATPVQTTSQNRVEYPTLSVLPPLKSLSVLDIDELAYLDEMSILIEKSKDRLLELRVGISKKATTRDFVLSWDGPDLQQVDHSIKWPGAPSNIGEKRLGGVLGILLGRVYDIRKKPKLAVRSKPLNLSAVVEPVAVAENGQVVTAQQESVISNGMSGASATSQLYSSTIQQPLPATVEEMDATLALSQGSIVIPTAPMVPDGTSIGSNPESSQVTVSATITSPGTEFSQPQPSPSPPTVFAQIRKDSQQMISKDTVSYERPYLDGKLRLRVLELERVPLSIGVLQKGFDWSVMTSLTVLDCAYHESLWKTLRRQFQPQPCARSALASSSLIRNSISTSKPIPNVPMEYQLNLKKIHTDFVTPALISFLKETLAPNTLEVLFLQDRRRNTPPPVSINDIYRGPLRRHRRSLKKLLIDSSDKIPKGPNNPSDGVRWKTWMLSHEVLAYLTSGNMTSLRELSIAIDYKDWVSSPAPN